MKQAVLTALFFVLAFPCTAMVQTGQSNIPPVETWQEMAVPYPDSAEVQAKFLTKWHKDPRGNKYEGSVGYFIDLGGKSTLFVKCWNFWDESGDGSSRNWSTIRVAVLMEDGTWVIGDPGEMIGLHWSQDKLSLTVRFDGAHSERSRTLVWK